MLTEEVTYEIGILQVTTKFLLLLHIVIMEAPQYKQKKMYVLNTYSLLEDKKNENQIFC